MGWAPGVGVGEGVGWAAGGGAGPVQQSSRSSGRGGGEHVREEQGDDALHSPPTPQQPTQGWTRLLKASLVLSCWVNPLIH